MILSLFRSAVPTLAQTGPGAEKKTHALTKEHTTIGRASEADIVVDDPYLAPIHARLERQKGGTFVIRRTGLNPVLLRGEAMLQTAALKPGDVFRLGRDVEFELVVKAAKETPKAKTESGEPAAVKPLLKRPAFLAGVALVYLLAIGGGAYALFSGGAVSDRPSAARVSSEADRIPVCIANARKLRQTSPEGFRGAVGTAATSGAAYVKLAAADEPADDAALATASAPIRDSYRSIMLAALDAEMRRNFVEARRLYQRGFDIVPDIKCSAARFAMARKAASVPPAND